MKHTNPSKSLEKLIHSENKFTREMKNVAENTREDDLLQVDARLALTTLNRTVFWKIDTS